MLQIQIIGHLGADAKLNVIEETGYQFITFSVAVNERKNNGEKETMWISCIKSGANENLLPYLKSGQQVFIQGTPKINIYTRKADGKTIADFNCNVYVLELVGKREQQTPQPTPEIIQACQQQTQQQAPPTQDDLPF